MTHIGKIKSTAAIQAIAIKKNKTSDEIRQAMQEALDIAWAEAWQVGNLPAQLEWQRLFPDGRKPSVEEFILNIAKRVQLSKDVPDYSL